MKTYILLYNIHIHVRFMNILGISLIISFTQYIITQYCEPDNIVFPYVEEFRSHFVSLYRSEPK